MQFYGSFFGVILYSLETMQIYGHISSSDRTNRSLGMSPEMLVKRIGDLFAKCFDHAGLGRIAVCPDSRTCNQNANHPWKSSD